MLDHLASEASYDAEYKIEDKHPKIIALCKMFADVFNSADAEKSLKKIYPEHPYRLTI